MVANPEPRERAILDLLKERYEDEGYAFFVYPSPSLVPTFLDDYRPDAIAVGHEGGVVIEVKGGHRAGVEPRATIADRFKDQGKWRYVVVYSDDYPAEILLPPPSMRDVERQLTEVEHLARDGHLGAAFVLSWGMLEAAARLAQAEPGVSGARPRSAAQLVESLERDGFLDFEAGAELRRLIDARNALVHGDLARTVSKRDVAVVVQAVRGLLADQAELPAAE